MLYENMQHAETSFVYNTGRCCFVFKAALLFGLALDKQLS